MQEKFIGGRGTDSKSDRLSGPLILVVEFVVAMSSGSAR